MKRQTGLSETVAGNKPILRGITWEHPRGYLPLAAGAAWSGQEPIVEVVWEQREWYAFEREVLHSLAGAADYDLVMLDHPWIGTFAESGWLLPVADGLHDSLRLQVDAASLETYIWNGRLWALPVDAACHLSACRPDLVMREIPSTWQEILSAGARP